MSALNPAMTRPARLAAVIALLIVMAAVLAGCSAASETSADSAGEPASGGAAEFGDDAAFAEPDTAADGESGSRPATSGRSFVITGALYMTVEDPIAAADRAAGIVDNAGGRIDARSETAPDEYNGGSASLTLRIPSDRLDAVVDDLRELGTVDEYATDSYDVTTEVTDLEATISTLRASTARIEGLLLEAEDISDIITLERELDSRQAELESLEARQRGLEDQVSLSTITLSLTTEPVVIVDDDPETFLDGLESGWNALVAFLTAALVLIGVMLPWLALIAVIVLVIVVAVRASLALKARRTTTVGHGADPARSTQAPPPPS